MFGGPPPFPLANDRLHELMVRGIGAAKEGSRDEAVRLLQLALEAGAGPDDRVKIWRALAEVAVDAAERRGYLEQIVATDPADGLARRDLALLDGRLTQADIAGRERPSASPAPVAGATRLVCRQCGSSALLFDAATHALVCQHCGTRQPVPAAVADAGARDFAAAMWSAGGHRTPTSTPSIACAGCGATFLAPAGQLSMTCPYCGTTYALDRIDTRQLISPDRMAPFATTRDEAAAALRRWIEEHRLTSNVPVLRGMFEPAWMLNFVGTIEWRGMKRSEHSDRNPEPVSGSYPIIDHTVRVPGTKRAPEVFGRLAAATDPAPLERFDARVLAGFPAALYDVSLDETMLIARRIAIDALRAEVLGEIGHIQNPSMDFSRMGVDVFTLALLPVWTGDIAVRGSRVPVLVDGRTGTVWANVPPGALKRAVSSLLSRLGLTDDRAR